MPASTKHDFSLETNWVPVTGIPTGSHTKAGAELGRGHTEKAWEIAFTGDMGCVEGGK
jgi:hypothetical protein